jgi:hypothetical protein
MSVIFASFILILLCVLFITASIHRSAYFLFFVRRTVPSRSIATHITALLNFFWGELPIQINMRGGITLLKCTTPKPSCSYRFPAWNLLFLSWIPNLWSTRTFPHNTRIVTRRGDSHTWVLDWMIGFTDTFFYNLSESQSIKITHNQSTAQDSLHSRSPVSILLQLLNSTHWTEILTRRSSQSQSHIATDGQSVSQ